MTWRHFIPALATWLTSVTSEGFTVITGACNA